MSVNDIGRVNNIGTNPTISSLGDDQTNQGDQVETDLSAEFKTLDIEEPKSTPPTLQIHQPNTTPARPQSTQPSIPTATAYDISNSADSDEEMESPISRPVGWDSDGSNDSNWAYHYMTRHEVRLYNEKRLREKADPIQAHLELIHQAFSNVDPKFTIFAFGGTIPADQIKCEDLRLRVWQQTSTPTRQGANVKDKRELGVGNKTAEADDIVASRTGGSGDRSGGRQEAVFQFPLIGENVEKLQKFASVAPFGKGNKTVYDPKYRKALEITPDRFEISPDPIMVNDNILDQIARTLHMTCKLRAEISKLNIYSKGGFFKQHCDTPKSSQHIGTIVLGLPGAYSGGQLVVGHGGPAITFDWGMQRYEFERGTKPPSEIHWAFLYGDCEHKVQKVHNGARITIAYDVYTIPGTRMRLPKNQAQSDKIYKVLQEALDDRIGFAKDGCTLAIGLSHSYPKTNDESLWKGLESRLKGPDAVLLQAVTRCALSYTYKAAFQRYMESLPGEDDIQEFGIAKQDRLSDTVLSALYRNNMKRFQVILTDEPDAVEGKTLDEFEPDGEYLFEILDHDQQDIKQLVWVDYPQSYGFKNDYEFIGNGPVDSEQAYSGVVMLINIPPADKR